MKVIGSVFLTLFLGLGLVPLSYAGQLDSHLEDVLRHKAADELIDVWIEMKSNHDSRALKRSVAASGATRAERHALALTTLKRRAGAQDELLSRLGDLENQKKAERIKGHWIADVIEARVSASELRALASRSDVETIYLEPVVELIAPAATGTPEPAPADVTGSTSNLQHIQANVAWDNGFTGAGSLICSFDTGVRGAHPVAWHPHDGHHGRR